MTAQGEYKSTLGLRDLYYALVQDDAGAYAADTPAYMAPLVNVSHAPACSATMRHGFDIIPPNSR